MYACEQCGKVFGWKKYLRQHIRQEHAASGSVFAMRNGFRGERVSLKEESNEQQSLFGKSFLNPFDMTLTIYLLIRGRTISKMEKGWGGNSLLSLKTSFRFYSVIHHPSKFSSSLVFLSNRSSMSRRLQTSYHSKQAHEAEES